VLTFNSGAVTSAEVRVRKPSTPWLAQFGPDAGRISHKGIGLNPACSGGTNASTLNHDVMLNAASFLARPQTLVRSDQLSADTREMPRVRAASNTFHRQTGAHGSV
jgi:hypothetical protein